MAQTGTVHAVAAWLPVAQSAVLFAAPLSAMMNSGVSFQRRMGYPRLLTNTAIISCTSRRLSGNRWYSHTQWLMISTGNR